MHLQSNWSVRPFLKDSFVYHEGTLVTEIFVVLRGQFIIYRLTAEGKSCTVRTLFEGEFIGEEDLLYGTRTEGYVQSVVDSECLVIPRDEYDNLILHYPMFARSRLVDLSKRLKSTERMMQEIAYSTVKQRLILILTKIGCEIGQNNSDDVKFTLDWSHQDLASMIGSTRETVTSTLSVLQKEGIVKIEGKKIVINKSVMQN